jgi:hypothetical protein
VGSGDQVTFPSAMRELVIRYFGEGPVPDFSRTPAILSRDPYKNVAVSFSRLGEVSDITSVDSDLGFVYAIAGHPDNPTIRLSVVGPYALVTNEVGKVIYPPDVVDLVRREGFVFVDRDVLERPFTYWAPAFVAPLYEFIFEFDEGFPWAR